MNSRERVLLIFDHKEADRVPVWCGASPEFLEKAKRALNLTEDESVYKRFGDDFRRVFAKYDGPKEAAPDFQLPEGITYRSPFGVLRHGYGYGQPLNHPLSEATLEEIHQFPWPDPSWMSAKDIRNDAQKWLGEYAILGGDWSPFWHDAIDLMGMENLMVKMYEDPELVHTLLTHIVDYYCGVNQIIFEEAADQIDIFFMGNDLGSQNGPLLGGELFNTFIFPHLKRLADLAHSYHLKVMLHCCGGIEPLIPTLIDAGIDALQALQPDALGMDAQLLKDKYGDKMVFNGCIDSHHVLISGTPKYTKEITKEIIDIMKPCGGFIVSPSHDFLLEETPVENVLAMYDTALEYGRY
ncbi:MAG: hypothetical protein H7X94_11500 [Vallitaleaceae bacterium]|nr:hypothetical protein [Vallitaleaceae bacterium]